MEYSDNYLREQLPREEPPLELVPGDVVDEIRRWSEYLQDESELVGRATRWTYAVFSELGLGRFTLDRPFSRRWPEDFWYDGDLPLRGTERLSFGLFDAETERPGLGIIVDVPQWPGPAFAIVDYASFPRLGEARFPVAIRQSEVDLHLSHPTGATSACWAQCKTTALWGILTAGHAINGNRAGRAVPMAAGGSGTLIRSFFQPVDAAFVLVPLPTHKPSPLPTLGFPAMGMPVSIDCQSGTVSRTIVEVMNNCGVLQTRAMGILIYLDTPASAGDSGALVRIASGEAVGICKGGHECAAVPDRPARPGPEFRAGDLRARCHPLSVRS